MVAKLNMYFPCFTAVILSISIVVFLIGLQSYFKLCAAFLLLLYLD